MEQMVMCGECSEVFTDSEIKRVRHSDGDAWDECPYCGSDDLFDVEQCDICGHWVHTDDVYFGLCKNCLLDRAENVRETLEYGRYETNTVHVNAVYAKAFSETQIDDILGRAFVNLLLNDMEKAAVDAVTDDLDNYARWITKQEELELQ